MAVPDPAPYVRIADYGVSFALVFLGIAVAASSVGVLLGLCLALFVVAVGGGVRTYILADAARIALNEREYERTSLQLSAYRYLDRNEPCPRPCHNPRHYHPKEDGTP